MLDHTVSEGLHLVKGTQAGAGHEELQSVTRTHAEKVCKELSPVGGTP